RLAVVERDRRGLAVDGGDVALGFRCHGRAGEQEQGGEQSGRDTHGFPLLKTFRAFAARGDFSRIDQIRNIGNVSKVKLGGGRTGRFHEQASACARGNSSRNRRLTG